MDSSFILKIIEPNKIYYNNQILSLHTFTDNGEIEILPFHSEYIANLEISNIEIEGLDKKIERYQIGGGAIHFDNKNNTCYLIVSYILREDEIDLTKLEEEKKVLEDKLKLNLSDTEKTSIERELRKIISSLKITKR